MNWNDFNNTRNTYIVWMKYHWERRMLEKVEKDSLIRARVGKFGILQSLLLGNNGFCRIFIQSFAFLQLAYGMYGPTAWAMGLQQCVTELMEVVKGRKIKQKGIKNSDSFGIHHSGIPFFHDVFRPLLAGIRVLRPFPTKCGLVRLLTKGFRLLPFVVYILIDYYTIVHGSLLKNNLFVLYIGVRTPDPLPTPMLCCRPQYDVSLLGNLLRLLEKSQNITKNVYMCCGGKLLLQSAGADLGIWWRGGGGGFRQCAVGPPMRGDWGSSPKNFLVTGLTPIFPYSQESSKHTGICLRQFLVHV
jgi:hypothetical protein